MTPWIDIIVAAAAVWAYRIGRGRGFGQEAWRLLRLFFPALFGIGLYKAMGGLLTRLPGLGDRAGDFWGFLLVTAGGLALMHRLRGKARTWFIAWGNSRPRLWGGVTGALRSLLVSGFVLFAMVLCPVKPIRSLAIGGSYLARLLRELLA